MGKFIADATKLTVESLLKAGEETWRVCEKTGVSSGYVQKIRNRLKTEGYEKIWHPHGGYVSRRIGS